MAEMNQECLLSQESLVNKFLNHNQMLNSVKKSLIIIEEEVANCHSGKGSLILSYGVTNSGKTHTIFGAGGQRGLLAEMIRLMICTFQTVDVTAVELYNDQFLSLRTKEKVHPKEACGSYQFEECQPQQWTVYNWQTSLQKLIKNRTQIETKANKKSSRSHAIFKLQSGKLTVGVVDLAGSQRLEHAGSSKGETSSINQSLLSLGRCIQAFRHSTVIPFRDSKLTKTLSQYFEEGCKLCLIAHINRSISVLYENYKVMEYAALAKQSKSLNPFVNRTLLLRSNRKNETPNNLTHSPVSKSQLKTIQNSQSKSHSYFNRMEEPQLKRERGNYLLQMYRAEMTGRDEEFNSNLSRMLSEMKRSDEKFKRGLQEQVYVSPVKSIDIDELRDKLKEEVEKDFLLRKNNNTVNYASHMGSSFKKYIEGNIQRPTTPRQGIFSKVLNAPINLLKSSAKKMQQAAHQLMGCLKKPLDLESFDFFHGQLIKEANQNSQFTGGFNGENQKYSFNEDLYQKEEEFNSNKHQFSQWSNQPQIGSENRISPNVMVNSLNVPVDGYTRPNFTSKSCRVSIESGDISSIDEGRPSHVSANNNEIQPINNTLLSILREAPCSTHYMKTFQNEEETRSNTYPLPPLKQIPNLEESDKTQSKEKKSPQFVSLYPSLESRVQIKPNTRSVRFAVEEPLVYPHLERQPMIMQLGTRNLRNRKKQVVSQQSTQHSQSNDKRKGVKDDKMKRKMKFGISPIKTRAMSRRKD